MKNNEQKVMLTGVCPSGNLTLGNYLGVRQAVDFGSDNAPKSSRLPHNRHTVPSERIPHHPPVKIKRPNGRFIFVMIGIGLVPAKLGRRLEKKLEIILFQSVIYHFFCIFLYMLIHKKARS